MKKDTKTFLKKVDDFFENSKPKFGYQTSNFDTRINTFDSKSSRFPKSDNHPNSDTYQNGDTFFDLTKMSELSVTTVFN